MTNEIVERKLCLDSMEGEGQNETAKRVVFRQIRMDSRRTVLYFLKQEEKDEVEEIQFGLGKNLQMFASPK